MAYLKNLLISADQFANTVAGGSPDETLSSRAYRAEQSNNTLGKILRPTIDLLFFFDAPHCYNSYLSEVHKRQLPLHFQEL